MPKTYQNPDQSMSPAVRRVRVIAISVDKTQAVVRDDLNATVKVPIDVLSGRGLPRVGEIWFIDHALGRWAFSRVEKPQPPKVTGSYADLAGLSATVRSLVSALAEIGLIDDQTG